MWHTMKLCCHQKAEGEAVINFIYLPSKYTKYVLGDALISSLIVKIM